MNERIRDLQIQAFAECKTFEGDKVKVRTDEVFERFAELIVKECAAAAYQSLYEDRVFDDSPVNIRRNVMDAVKKHFGVEE